MRFRFWVDWQGDNPVPEVVDFMKQNYGITRVILTKSN